MIKTTVKKSETGIAQIKFYSGSRLLCTAGYSDESLKTIGGRTIKFEIAADEQLIGACVYSGGGKDCDDYFKAV